MRGVIGGLLLLGAAACSGADQPCSSYCAPLAGQYQLALQNGTLSADCVALGASPAGGVLDITQDGSALVGTLGNTPLTGTLYQSLSFTLTGEVLSLNGRQELTTIRGLYAPQAPDAGGGLLSGTYDLYIRQPEPGGTRTCTLDLAFDAQPL